MVLSAGDRVLNKYEVISHLGSGRSGSVYRVANLNLGHESALKLVEVQDPTTHKAEIEALAQSICGHDHVVKIHTADIFDRHVIIEMEYVSGGSFENLLRSEFVPIIETVRIVKQVLFALEHAHSRGIVHRDVKPANIMLAGSCAKLSDFGTAMHPVTGIRVTDQFYRPHASPEAVNGREFSAVSDVFATGMTLLRAANNQSNWDAILNGRDWRQDVLEGRLADVIGFTEFVPTKIRRIIKKAVKPAPEDRYQSASEMRQALERLVPARAWSRVNEHIWKCLTDRGEEVIEYVGGRRFSVDYKLNGRRRSENCRDNSDERSARRYLHQTVAKTTFA